MFYVYAKLFFKLVISAVSFYAPFFGFPHHIVSFVYESEISGVPALKENSFEELHFFSRPPSLNLVLVFLYHFFFNRLSILTPNLIKLI